MRPPRKFMTRNNFAPKISEEERREAKKAQQAYINRIKGEISLEEVLRRLGLYFKKIGKSSFSRCPYPDHNERTASFAADFRKNLWKCFGCGRGGDALRIVRDLEASGDWGETLKWFERNFNLLSPAGMQRQIQVRESLKTSVPVIELSKALTAPDELFAFYDEVYQALIDELPLDNYAADEMQSRGVTRDWAEKLGYCNLPISFAARTELAIRFAEHFDLENNHVPGFFRLKYKDEFKNWCFGGDGAGSRYLAVAPNQAAASEETELPLATLAAAENDPATISDIVRHKYVRDYQSPQRIYIGGLLVPQRDRTGRVRAIKIRNQSFTPELWLRSRRFSARLTGNTAFEHLKTLPAADQESYLAHKDFWIAKYIALASSEEKKGAGALLGIHWSLGAAARREMDEEKFNDEAGSSRLNSTYRSPIARRAENPEYPQTMVEPSDAVIWLTEGELKADLIGYFLGVKTVALPGLAGHHFELFWEMGCYGELTLLQAREIFDRVENSRLEWLDYKLNKYKVPVFHGTDVSSNSPEVQKKLLFAPLEEKDAAVLSERFSASPPCTSFFKSLIIALDEDFSLNVEKSAHRLAWHALHLNLPVVRCRWDGKVGKGFDDLLNARGEWRLEGFYGKL